jgi:hypothetical protein
MKSVAGEDVALLTAREPDANHHVILAIANPRHRKGVTLRCCSYLRIAVVDPRRLGRPIDRERFVGDKAVLSIAIRVKCLRAEHQQGSQAQDDSGRYCYSHRPNEN